MSIWVLMSFSLWGLLPLLITVRALATAGLMLFSGPLCES